MDHRAMAILVNNAGNNLHRIDSEIEKIVANTGEKKAINVSDLEATSGIDKNYNIFEFSRAVGQRNLSRCLEIGEVVGRDKRNTPLLMVIPVLFNYFKRIQLVHETGSHQRDELVRKLGINPYFVQEYVSAANKYPPVDVRKAFNTLQEMDLRTKGVGQIHGDDYQLLRELIVRVIS